MNPRRLIDGESPQHIRAKNRMARWLTQAADSSAGPAYRVVVEYPFGDCGEGCEEE